ncbi:MAG TPA: DUF6760 family protein [bacterium]|nr:DUF6760 family protein [bacterium]
MRYPLEQISREVAFLAYHFHWSRDEILQMSHRERQQWVREISTINEEINNAE